jgi:hypothetical protein
MQDVAPPAMDKSEMNRDFAFMNALSAWTVALRCPFCGCTGSGAISEDVFDGQKEPRLRVDGLSSGFVVVELRPGPAARYSMRDFRQLRVRQRPSALSF